MLPYSQATHFRFNKSVFVSKTKMLCTFLVHLRSKDNKYNGKSLQLSNLLPERQANLEYL